jgi:tRNA threonylcarbamoyladenosine biosynthesis protein TsaB
MRLLAIDTSTEYLTLAVTDGAEVRARLHRKAPRSHSSLLVPMIDAVLRKARLRLKDIDGFCVGVGPGSFTGLRIGVATVKALAAATGRPIAAVPTFDAIARNAKKSGGAVCVVLDARKNKVYGAVYSADAAGGLDRVTDYMLLPAGELLKVCEKYDNLYYIGDYAGRMRDMCARAGIVTGRWHPQARDIAALGLEMLRKKKATGAESLEPMYIYSKECDITGK